jgi:Protein of unknown function (DUF2934)
MPPPSTQVLCSIAPRDPLTALVSSACVQIAQQNRANCLDVLIPDTPVKILSTLGEQDFGCRAGRIMKGENPMPNLEEAIRERAYHLWIAGGQPEGQADVYWLKAQREILPTSVESPGSSAAAAAPTDTGSVGTKPDKRARLARSGKSKTRAA